MSRLTTIRKALCRGAFCAFLIVHCSLGMAASASDVDTFADNYPGLSTEALLRLVVKGDELAQHEWGNRLAMGTGGAPVNRSAAAMWYSRAAQRGTPGSASLSALPNAPLRVDRTASSTLGASPPPDAQIGAPTDSAYELTRNIDGSSSTSSQTITHYIWDAWPDNAQNGSATLTDLGSGQAQVIFPDVGTWYVTLIVLDASGQIDHHTQTHTVLEPVILAPESPNLTAPATDKIIQSTTAVEFSWTVADDVDFYDFEIFTKSGNPEAPTSLVASQTVEPSNCATGSCALNAIVTAATGSELFWRVSASNTGGTSEWSEDRMLIVALATSAPNTPSIVSPLDNADLNSGLVTEFVWQHEAQVETYEFFFTNNDPDGDVSPLISGLRAFDLCDEGTCRYEALVNVPVHDGHTWSVKAINSSGESGWAQSSFNSVVPATEAPTAPILSSPRDDITIPVGQNTGFKWARVATASAYELLISDAANSDLDAINAFVRDSNCDANSCTTTIAMDLPTADTYQWQVRATNAVGASAYTTRHFSIQEKPGSVVTLSPLSDSEVAVGSTVTFLWQRDDKAESYDFYLYDNTNKSFTISLTDLVASAICTDEICSVTEVINTVVGTRNQWRVRGKNLAGNSSLSQSFFTALEPHTEAPATFTLIAPASGESVVQNEQATFSWTAADRAESYQITLPGANGNAVTTDVLTNNCVSGQCNYSTTVALPIEENYEWQVSAINSVGQTDSNVSTFSVVFEIIEPPEAPTLALPLALTSFDVYSPITFEWQAVSDATSYEFFITDGNEGAQELQSGLLPADICAAGSCTISIDHTLGISDSHSWHVRAKKDDVESQWSERSFAVVTPTAPTLLLPLATTELESEDTVVFQWNAVDAATTYDFYITDSISGAQPTLADLPATDYCDAGTCSIAVVIDLSVSDSHTWRVRTKRQDIASVWTERTLVVIPPTEPVALFSMLGFEDSNATRIGPLTIEFDPSASSDDDAIVEYEWDFGDGSEKVTNDNDETQSHTYDTAGTFMAKLQVTDTAGLTNEKTATITVLDSGTPATDTEAARLLTQATFGPTLADIERVQTMGMNNWIDWQLSSKGSAHLDYVSVHSNNSGRGPRHEIWWADVVEGDDQLRQRVAFALSQIFVISDTGFTLSNAQYGVTNYYDTLRNYAFGNYRELLEEVTLSPIMGLYLSMLQNAKGQADGSTRADENYAREILQLFSIGLHNLNVDGTTDGSPSFTQDQIEAFARVFTGWNYADAGVWDRGLSTNANMIDQMQPFEEYHDTDAKTLLNGVVAPAGNTARQDLELALDNIFNHPNVGPFIAKQLIKRLVTSNPTPAYVGRVAHVFNNNGTGVRGDLGAVVKAILLDTEARTIPTDISHYGKLREPVLRLSHLWRAFNVQRGENNSDRNEFNTVSPQMDTLETVTGQAVLRSPSVFNFFLPSYSPAGPVADANLDAPEFELFTAGNELATSNRIARQIQVGYAGYPYANGQSTSYLDYTYELTLADDAAALLDHLDLVLLSGNMSDGLRNLLQSHIESIPSDEDGLSQRIRDAITLIMASPDYLVQM